MSGPFASKASELIREAIGARDVLLTTSCTDALEMTAMLLELGPGDTVIVPSFTFVSTALAFARQGARLLFCDIEPETLGLDPACLDELLDETVRAVVPVHYAGVGCDMNGIRHALEGTSIEIIEDNAHGLFGRYRDEPLGGMGRFATLSFHETKNFICGEGGALILNDERDVILEKRRTVTEQYRAALAPIAGEFGVQLPAIPADRGEAYHMFYVLLPDGRTRDAVLEGMRAHGVQPTFHYVPLHSAPGADKYAKLRTKCPVTDDVSRRLLRLPFHNNLSADDIERVVGAFRDSLVAARAKTRS
jgi:dTDP-4-amino-4,6-dideoxygalactose transaminase